MLYICNSFLKIKQQVCKREIIMKKLQYLRPQTEVIAATSHHLMGVSFYGYAGDGDLVEVGDAKETGLGFEFSFRDVWEELDSQDEK